MGLNRPSPSARVRTPQPENSRLPMRCAATALALDLSTIPLHRRWPLFEVSVSTCRPSSSRATAKYWPSSTQKSRLNRRFRSAASFSRRSANPTSCHTEPGQARAADLGVIGIALELACGAGEPRQGAVAERDRVPRVLPALVLEAGLLVAALVGDVAVALEVGVLVDPGQRGAGLELQFADELGVPGPALVLIHQDDVQGRGVRTAVVRRVRALLEGGELAVAHLVEDAAGVLVPEVVEACPLAGTEGPQRGGGQVGREGQRLEAGEDAVAAEHGHEPRQAGSRQGVLGEDGGDKAQGGEIDQAATVGDLERVVVALEARGVVEPALEVPGHATLRSLARCAQRLAPGTELWTERPW